MSVFPAEDRVGKGRRPGFSPPRRSRPSAGTRQAGSRRTFWARTLRGRPCGSHSHIGPAATKRRMTFARPIDLPRDLFFSRAFEERPHWASPQTSELLLLLLLFQGARSSDARDGQEPISERPLCIGPGFLLAWRGGRLLDPSSLAARPRRHDGPFDGKEKHPSCSAAGSTDVRKRGADTGWTQNMTTFLQHRHRGLVLGWLQVRTNGEGQEMLSYFQSE